MLACLAFTALLAATPASIPDLAQEVEADARALTLAVDGPAPGLGAGVADFSADAMALSEALRAAGAAQDLPCIFKGIAEDAPIRLADYEAAQSEAARAAALADLRALLDDAILLAPMAAREAP